MKLTLKKIIGADSYRFEYTPAPVSADAHRAVLFSTRSGIVASNLTSSSRYAFRVAGIGSNPTCVYSDELVSYIL